MSLLSRFKGGAEDDVRSPKTLTSGAWQQVSAFCQVVLTGTGTYTYDTQDASGSISTGVGAGNVPDIVPIYMGGAVNLRVNFSVTATAKVN